MKRCCYLVCWHGFHNTQHLYLCLYHTAYTTPSVSFRHTKSHIGEPLHITEIHVNQLIRNEHVQWLLLCEWWRFVMNSSNVNARYVRFDWISQFLYTEWKVFFVSYFKKFIVCTIYKKKNRFKKFLHLLIWLWVDFLVQLVKFFFKFLRKNYNKNSLFYLLQNSKKIKQIVISFFRQSRFCQHV